MPSLVLLQVPLFIIPDTVTIRSFQQSITRQIFIIFSVSSWQKIFLQFVPGLTQKSLLRKPGAESVEATFKLARYSYKALYQLTHDYNSLCVADVVQSDMGRTVAMFACERFTLFLILLPLQRELHQDSPCLPQLLGKNYELGSRQS